MRSIMRVGAAAVALLVAANVAVAQDGGGRRGGGGGGRGGPGGITMLMQNITVDAAVQGKIDALTTAFTDAQAKLREEAGLPAMGRGGGGGGGGGAPPDSAKMAAYQTKNTELTAKLRADVKALLTPEQQKTFDENLANMPQGRGGRRGGGE
ncbi:MAG TPA: Spy/CpxP family protein refolding chaperone [Gemmatimonadaceae bacterium]|nr:Spy/CpxP family protein refolding chaperone [Gemmatimonadaceae bacterium]